MVVRNANLPEGEYWIYLRKSRADLEAEAKALEDKMKFI